MFPCVGVVQGAHDDVKSRKPIGVEAVLLDVRADGLDVDGGVECRSRASGDGRLGLFYVLFAEEELAVQVGEVDRIEIQQSDVPKSSQNDVFHCVGFYQILFMSEGRVGRGRTEFAAYAATANDEDSCIPKLLRPVCAQDGLCVRLSVGHSVLQLVL